MAQVKGRSQEVVLLGISEATLTQQRSCQDLLKFGDDSSHRVTFASYRFEWKQDCCYIYYRGTPKWMISGHPYFRNIHIVDMTDVYRYFTRALLVEIITTALQHLQIINVELQIALFGSKTTCYVRAISKVSSGIDLQG